MKEKTFYGCALTAVIVLILCEWFWFRPSPWIAKPVSALFILSWLMVSSRPYRPAVGLLLVGAILNAVAVLANGGRMPVALEYWEPSDRPPTHQPMSPDTILPWLTDVLLGGSSVGDWFVFLGLGMLFGVLTFKMLGLCRERPK